MGSELPRCKCVLHHQRVTSQVVFVGPTIRQPERSAAMTLAYGYVKTKVTSEPVMKPSHHGHETQYHLHCNLQVDGASCDAAINVGTNDADDLLKYKLAFDFRHPLIQALAAAAA